MPHDAAFHLDLNCLQKYLFRFSRIQRVKKGTCKRSGFNPLNAGKYFMLFSHLLTFFKIIFFKKFFQIQEYHQSGIQIRPDGFVGPDLGPDCKSYQQMTLG